ncbi:hypothetical protein ScPMuIL_011819 [Solemya velum]
MAAKSGMEGENKSKIAIVGSGLIGQNWAMIFASVGYRVAIYDVVPEQLTRAHALIKDTLGRYEKEGHLRGKLTSTEQIQNITACSSLTDCLEGAVHVQECVPEDLNLKVTVFQELDKHCSNGMVVASSSSCLPASSFTESLEHRNNMLVAHPINPPYFIPLVEIVPAPWTDQAVVNKTRALMENIGQSPVTLKYEAPGFALNRMQYAIINESWNMYQTGLLSAEDIDRVCHTGLGLRYAFIGPLETMHLNANGMVDYCQRYADGAEKVQKETFKQIPVKYDIPTAEKIQEEFESYLPLDKIPQRRTWRDGWLAALASLKLADDKK